MHANSWIWDGKHPFEEVCPTACVAPFDHIDEDHGWGRVLTGTTSAGGRIIEIWLTNPRERSDVSDLLGLDGIQVVLLVLTLLRCTRQRHPTYWELGK